MSSSTEDRMDDIVRAARKIVKAARAGDADAVLNHAMTIEQPLHTIMSDLSADEWNDRTGTEQALEAWGAGRTSHSPGSTGV